jgi:chromosomal replication initiator protein
MSNEPLGIVAEGERRYELYGKYITRQVDEMREEIRRSLVSLVREVVEAEMQSLAERRSKRISQEILAQRGASLSLERIKQAICITTNYSWEAFTGGRRQKGLCRARHFAFYIVHQYRPDLSSPQIGLLFGGRDHTTILYGLNQTVKRMNTKPISDWLEHPTILALQAVNSSSQTA